MVLLAAGSVLLLVIGMGTSSWIISVVLVARAFGIGLVIQPLILVAVGRVHSLDAPDANTLFMIANRIGGAVGIALLVTLFQVRAQALALTQGVRGAVTGFHEATWVLAATAALGLAVAVAFLRDRGRGQWRA